MYDKVHNPDPIAFKLVEYHHNKYIFENRSHDFAQRIIYHSPPPDSILVRVEGEDKGKMKRIDFLFGRE